MPFQDATRRKIIALSQQSKGTTNPLQWDIPRTGLLAAIYLDIQATLSGTITGPNAYGVSSIIRKVRLITNAGIDLVNISGPGYTYLFQNLLDDYTQVTVQNQGNSAVAVGSFNIGMILPVALNARDPIGLFMLQNEQTLVQLQVEFEADANVGTGATVVATVQPFIEVFTVPIDPKDWPALNVVQQVLEDTVSGPASGDFDYVWPRGNTYIQVAHGYGAKQSAADNWTRAKLIVNQSEVIMDYTVNGQTLEWNRLHGRARGLGVVVFDMIGTSGLGTMGSSRDLLYSGMVTDLLTRITSSGADTLRTIRRQLVALR